MHQNMTHPYHATPGNIRIFFSQFIGNSGSRLPNNFDMVNYPNFHEFVILVRYSTTLIINIMLDFLNSFEHIL